jgi:TolB-like protein
MAPEQLRGGRADHRSDLFSLGMIVYEMIAGHRPFEAATGAETISAILRDDPPPLAGVPSALARLIDGCLAKSPDARPQSARDVALALDALGYPSGVGVAAPALAEEEGQARTIAVLPFANVSADPDNEYFSDGLTEELIHELTRIPRLRVVAWHSASRLKGHEQDLDTIRQQLKADVVLTGSVRRAGDRVRIAAQLVDTVSGYYLWSESYDRELQDLFAIQQEIARSIVTTLTRALGDERRLRLLDRATSNPEAYNLYLKGRFFLNRRTEEGLRRGVESFGLAIERDPGACSPSTAWSIPARQCRGHGRRPSPPSTSILGRPRRRCPTRSSGRCTTGNGTRPTPSTVARSS